jgi:hypothetical protein
MLKARPKSLWSWNFIIPGASRGDMFTTLDQKSEGGTIGLAGRTYAIAKQKIGLGQWTVTAGATTYAEARITGQVISKMEITAPEGLLLAQAPPFSRTYDFTLLEKKVGTIKPAHLLTRESTIDFSGNVSELTQVFCFWMAALKWYYGSQD